MITKQLGQSDLHLTTIGFGAWAIGGGDWAYAWGPQDDQDSLAAIRRALDAGVNWIDTAAVYGLGHSEEIVGKAIAGRRGEVTLATKCSLVWDGGRQIRDDLSAKSVRRECEASLRRLNTDVIDLYQIHWPTDQERIEEGWAEMARLVEEGKVRHIGVSNFNVEQMERIRPIHPIASLQPPYSMLRRGIEDEILPYCAEHEIGVLAYSPMLSGLLTGKYTPERIAALPEDDWRRRNKEFQPPHLDANLALVDGLRPLAERHGGTVGNIAVAWVNANPVVTSAIVGARSAAQVAEIVQTAELTLSPDELTEVQRLLDRRTTSIS